MANYAKVIDSLGQALTIAQLLLEWECESAGHPPTSWGLECSQSAEIIKAHRLALGHPDPTPPPEGQPGYPEKLSN